MKKLMMILMITTLMVSCGKNEPIKMLMDGSHMLVQEAGGFIEDTGRIPRQLANKLLGTHEDTDEKVERLEDQVATIYSELYDLDEEIESMQNVSQQIIDFQNYLFDEIRSNDRDIRRIKRQIRRLKNIVRGLTVQCDHVSYFNLVTDCSLIGN